jgi:hypothetical protein
MAHENNAIDENENADNKDAHVESGFFGIGRSSETGDFGGIG